MSYLDRTLLFGLIEICVSIVHFYIFGLCVAHKSSLIKFTATCPLSMGLLDLFNGIYYLHQSLSFSPFMLSLVYACAPFTYLTCFIAAFQYAFSYKSIKYRKPQYIIPLIIIPIVTVVLSLTHKYQNFYLSYGDYFAEYIFNELVTYQGFWLNIVKVYDFILFILTISCFIFSLIKLIKLGRKVHFIFILIILTIIIDIMPVATESELLLYVDLFIRLLSIIAMYKTLYRSDSQELIFQGQKNFIESSPYPIVILNKQRRIVYANQEAVTICPNIFSYVRHNKYLHDFLSNFVKYNENNTFESNELQETILKNKYTQELYSLKSTNLLNKKSNVIGKINLLLSMNTMQSIIENLKSMAWLDKLTGFYNRNYLEARKLDFETNYIDCEFTIIMCDLNNLKKLNDKLGHDIGDKYILYCCSIIRKGTRQNDIIIRLGGDEFLIILPNTSNKIGTMIANRINNCQQFENFCECEEQYKKYLGIATGVATSFSSNFDFLQLIKKADKEMYSNKRIQKLCLDKKTIKK